MAATTPSSFTPLPLSAHSAAPVPPIMQRRPCRGLDDPSLRGDPCASHYEGPAAGRTAHSGDSRLILAIRAPRPGKLGRCSEDAAPLPRRAPTGIPTARPARPGRLTARLTILA